MAAADIQMAEELGVHPGLVGSMRRDSLLEGRDWTREAESGRVDYTPEGRERLRDLLGCPQKNEGGGAAPAVPLNPPEEVRQDGGCPPALPEPLRARLRVVRMMPNPLWVAVEKPGGGVAEVRVMRSGSLRPGHLLVCELLPDGRWECVQSQHACAMPGLPKKERGAA